MTETKMDNSTGKPEWAQSKREKDNAARQQAGLKPLRRRWPWVVLALVVVAGIVGFFVIRGQQGAAPSEVAETPPAEVTMQLNPAEVTTITPQVLQQTVRVTGPLAPQRQTVLASQVSGRIESVSVRAGDRVSPGDILVQIDTENLRIELAQQRSTAQATRAQLVLAESQLTRTQDLNARGLTTPSGLEEAQSNADALRANLAALQSQVAAAEIALRNATVTAPFRGIVSERSIDPGQTVSSGTALLTIVNLDVLEMQGSAPVGSGALVSPGQTVMIGVQGVERTFEGRVERVNPVAAAGTRTIPVYITMDNPDGVLRGGMFATGQIVVLEEADALAVPRGALREDAEGFFVLKVEGDRVVRQGIEQGEEWNRGQLVQITSGLTDGDMVVTAPLTQLQPGDRVAMVEG